MKILYKTIYFIYGIIFLVSLLFFFGLLVNIYDFFNIKSEEGSIEIKKMVIERKLRGRMRSSSASYYGHLLESKNEGVSVPYEIHGEINKKDSYYNFDIAFKTKSRGDTIEILYSKKLELYEIHTKNRREDSILQFLNWKKSIVLTTTKYLCFFWMIFFSLFLVLKKVKY